VCCTEWRGDTLKQVKSNRQHNVQQSALESLSATGKWAIAHRPSAIQQHFSHNALSSRSGVRSVRLTE